LCTFTLLFVYIHTPTCVHSHSYLCTFALLLVFIHTPTCVHSHSYLCSFALLLVFIHTKFWAARNSSIQEWEPFLISMRYVLCAQTPASTMCSLSTVIYWLGVQGNYVGPSTKHTNHSPLFLHMSACRLMCTAYCLLCKKRNRKTEQAMKTTPLSIVIYTRLPAVYCALHTVYCVKK